MPERGKQKKVFEIERMDLSNLDPQPLKVKLYGVDAKNLKFGVTGTGRVAHIIGVGSTEQGTELDFSKIGSDTLTSGYGEVSKEEVFTNEGDKATSELYMQLALMSEQDYNDFYGYEPVKEAMIGVRNLITCSGRSAQQADIKELKLCLKKNITDLRNKKEQLLKGAKERYDSNVNVSVKDGDVERNASQGSTLKSIDDVIGVLEKYDNILNSLFNGKMVGNAEYDKNRKPNEIKEPADATWLTGMIGSWKETNSVLFPHAPSPNDVKQGLGLQSCFMMSVLVQMASKHPDDIMNSMRDNGDGTVTVRFHKLKDGTENQFEDVFVDVKKSIKMALGGNVNVYSSSSLWVQIMEKAYAEFLNKYYPEAGRPGLNRIETGDSAEFMTALTGVEHGSTISFSPALSSTKSFYQGAKRPAYYYLPEEQEIYAALKEEVNNKDNFGLVTTGISGGGNHNKKECNNIGLRCGHAYAITKVFEKEVNGAKRYFVQLREPYATFLTAHDSKGKLVDNSHEILGTLNAGTNNMGTFNMELSEYLDYFDGIHMSKTGVAKLAEIAGNFRDYGSDKYKLTKAEMDSPEHYNHELKAECAKERKERMAKVKIEEKDDFVVFDDDKPKNEPEDKAVSDNAKIAENEKLQRDDSFADVDIVELSESQLELDEKEPEIIKPTKEEEALVLINRDRPPVERVLNDHEAFENFKNQINAAVVDIHGTDPFYITTNTEAFVNMRDSLYALNKLIGKIDKSQDKGKFTGQLIESVTSLKNNAEKYIDAKYDSINAEFKKKDVPSVRAFHRFLSARNIVRLCDMSPMAMMYGQHKLEKFGMIATDLKVEMATYNGDDKKILENMKKTAQIVSKVFDNREALKAGRVEQSDIDAIKEYANSKDLKPNVKEEEPMELVPSPEENDIDHPLPFGNI